MVELKTARGPLLIPVELRRTRRTRHIRIWIGYEHQAVLSVPWGCRYATALNFLNSQGDWVEQQLRGQTRPQSLPEFLTEQRFVSAEGKAWPLRFHWRRPRTQVKFDRKEGVIRIDLNPFTETDLTLIQSIRGFAGRVIRQRVSVLADRLGLEQPSVSVRDQVSRWGSCSSSRMISLNWRLILLKPSIMDYVIYHELAHLTEMNHADSFWNLLKSYDRKSLLHDRTLNQVSRRLMQVGRL